MTISTHVASSEYTGLVCRKAQLLQATTKATECAGKAEIGLRWRTARRQPATIARYSQVCLLFPRSRSHTEVRSQVKPVWLQVMRAEAPLMLLFVVENCYTRRSRGFGQWMETPQSEFRFLTSPHSKQCTVITFPDFGESLSTSNKATYVSVLIL